MGVDYSAAIAYGFPVENNELNIPEDSDEYDFLEDHDIDYHWAGDLYDGDLYVFLSVRDTYRRIDFRWDTYKEANLPESISVEDFEEFKEKIEKAGIPWKMPNWYMTTLIS